MDIFRLDNFSFAYPEQKSWCLSELNCAIPQGSFTLICGASASGKSTFLRRLKPILAPKGFSKGNIYFKDAPLSQLTPAEQSQKIGFVLQNIENQLVTDKVWHELAFGLESLNLPSAAIRRRVGEIADFFGIGALFEKRVDELSGGQKQLVNLAAVMVMQPEVLILDEPTAMLDPLAAANFIQALQRLNEECGTTVIIAEQRLDEVFPLARQVIVLEQGIIIAQGSATEAAQALLAAAHPFSLSLPAPCLIQWAADKAAPLALSVRQGQIWLENYLRWHQPLPFEPQVSAPAKDWVLKLEEVHFSYSPVQEVLNGFSLELRRGELLALIGSNGSGKSTALALMAQNLACDRGKIISHAKTALLPQNPQALFCQSSVLADLKADLPPDTSQEDLDYVINLCQLGKVLAVHPYDLSAGEQQRLAFAKILLLKPQIILLDEPTKGMDNDFKEFFGHILKDLQARGISLIMACHDLAFCAQYADRIAFCFNGQIVDTAPPHEFFSHSSYLTTPTSRMCRKYMPAVITPPEAIAALGGHLPPAKPPLPPKAEPVIQAAEDEAAEKPALSKKTKLSLFCALILIPLTVFVNVYWFQSHYYSFFALLILLECMLPFYIIFEGRKPQARELVIIAIFCALGVAGRIVFFMLPQFKPVMAIVIIAAVSFGKEYGFLIGSLTMLVSNMLLGMGPWVVWQMFAMGLIGFLGGCIFAQDRLRPKKTALCLFGAFCAVFIYGGLMNPASAILSRQVLSLPLLLSYYASGLPLDIIHAAATVIFLWLLAEPLLEKTERLKKKYAIRR